MRQCGRPSTPSGHSDLSLVSADAPILRKDISHLTSLLPPSIPSFLNIFPPLYAASINTMHLVLTGATGLVGSAILQQMIVTPSVSKVSVLSRRPVAQAEGHEKVEVIIHKDFTSYSPELLGQLKDVDGVVWAQGISSTLVSKPYDSFSLPSLQCLQIVFRAHNVKCIC